MLLMWEAQSTRAINIILLLTIAMNRCGISCELFLLPTSGIKRTITVPVRLRWQRWKRCSTQSKCWSMSLARIRRPNTVAEVEAGLTGGVVVPAVEVPFEIRFPGLEIPPCPALPEGAFLSVIGYIDAIMQNQINSLYRTLDIKTSRMKLLDATGKYRYDSQQVPYGIVVEHIAQGEIESFEVLYLDCYVDILDPTVQLYPFIKTRHDLQDWATNKLIQFRQIAGFATSDYFPRTDGGCLFYNKPCRYLEPCQSRDRPSLIEWFMMGSEELKEPEPFFPWITAEVNLGVAV
jgi:hypothetical protein